jgi:hypothetical protein
VGIKGWIDNLKGVTRAVQAGGSTGPGTVPPPAGADDGPAFAPIAGVDLPTFTRVSHGLTSRGLTEEGPALAFVAEQGLDPAAWKTVAEGWNERIIGDNAVKARFGQLYFALDADA